MTNENNNVQSFMAVLCYTAALLVFAGVTAGTLSLSTYWWVVLLALLLGIGFTGAAMRIGRENPSTAIVASSSGGSGLTMAGTSTMEREREPAVAGASASATAAQVGVADPSPRQTDTVTGEIDGQEVVYPDPLDKAAVEGDTPDTVSGAPEPVAEADDDAVVYEQETVSGDGDAEMMNAVDASVAPAEEGMTGVGEQRQRAVNEDELETDEDRREAAETGETVDDSTGDEMVEVGDLTSYPPTTPEEREAEEKLMEDPDEDDPTDDIPVEDSQRASDDLTRIEGIGPKMSAALISQGIATFGDLADATVERIQEAISAEGLRFAPSAESWAEQARYAARGDWDGLKEFQGTLDSGRYRRDE